MRDNRIILSGSEDEAGAAVLEEKECLEIEKQRLARMKEEDYMPHFMKVVSGLLFHFFVCFDNLSMSASAQEGMTAVEYACA